MSYNLLSGSVEFVGDALGLTENLVNTHATQAVTGAKTFYNVTASQQGDGTVGLTVLGTLSVDGDITSDADLTVGQYIKHDGDPDTHLEFGADNVGLTAGGNLGLDISTSQIQFNGDAGQPDTGNQNLDFIIYSRDQNNGFKYDAGKRSAIFGFIGNYSFDKSDVLLNITSSYHTGSLLSVGNGKNPVFAVSGSADYDTQSPRVLITGSLLVGGRHGSTQETAYTGGNIIAEGVITGSVGLRGELLNIGGGLEHVAGGGEKLLSVEAHTGISVSNQGVAVDVHGLTDVGSVNTSTSNQDFICVSDYSNSNATRKMGVGDLLGNTVGTAANLGTGAEVYKTAVSRELKFRKIRGHSPIDITENTDDISVRLGAIGSVGQVLYHHRVGSNQGTDMILVDDAPGTGMMDMGGGTVSLGGIASEVNVTGTLAVKGDNTSLDGQAHTQGDAVLFTVSGHTNNNILLVTGSNMVGVGGVTAPQATLDVKGMIAISNEESGTPSQPPDGNGLLYTKTDGKLYWRSYDVGETDLTVGTAGGANGEILYNLSGALEGHGTYKMVTRNTPGQTEVYLTGTMHAQNIEIAQEAEIYEADCQQLTASAAHLNGGVRLYSTAKTANYNLQSQDRIVIFNTNTNVTATLPDIVDANVGQVYTIKNVNAGEVHITGSNPGAEQLIDGTQYLVLSSSAVGNGPYLTVTSYSTGAGFGWAVIARQLSSDPH